MLALADAGCSGDDATSASDGGKDGTADVTTDMDGGGGDATDGGVFDAGPPCADAGADLPKELRCTGLYSDFGSKTVAPDNKPYTPGLTFWSDGAEKSRWLYLPPGAKIDTSNMDEWVFPVGTKVWKEFRIGGHRVETRLLVKTADASWLAATYLWSQDESDAKSIELGVLDAGGGYEVPNLDACIQCHGGRNDRLLGVEAIALGLPAASGVTLTTLKNENRLTAPPATTTFTLPGAAVDNAALGWLHINCGVACHNKNQSAGASFTGFFMRLSAPAYFDAGGVAQAVNATDTYTTGVNRVAPSYDMVYPAGSGYRVIVKGDAGHSVVPLVDGTRGPGQMPPIATHKVDDAGVQSVITWINQLQ